MKNISTTAGIYKERIYRFMVSKRDYYKVLGIAPTATQEEIRKAYRMLSKKYHPDLNPDLKLYSDDRMKELVEAYNVLNDPDSRKEYDKQPQFQIRKFRKNTGVYMDTSRYTKKPKYKKEETILDKIFSRFMKKKEPVVVDDVEAEIDPKQGDVHFTLGLTMAENEAFYDQALNEFKLAVKFNPNHAEALYNLALMCYKKGYYEEAIVNFQKVLLLNKDDQHARKMINLLREEF